MNDPHNYNEPISVLKDCEAILIPEGSTINLKEGTTVYITQALGGSVTVNVNGMLARIAASDVAAIGLEPTASPVDSAVAAADGSVDEALIWEQLKTCYDPEIPIDVVELGLIPADKLESLPLLPIPVVVLTILPHSSFVHRRNRGRMDSNRGS